MRLRALGPGLLLFFTAIPARAGGWQEAHQTSDDVRITLEPDGTATVVHHLRYRVVAGRFKTLDIVGIHPSAELSPDATIASERSGGQEIAAHVEPVTKTPGTIRVGIDEGKGLSRGGYTFDVKYKLDLVATKLLVRDGGLWKLTWTAPPAPEGHDGARVIFDLPSAPTEPRLAAGPEGSTTLTTLRRSLDRDELELVRAHVPRGDAIAWSARVDPKAFPMVNAPELRPPPPVVASTPSFVASHLNQALLTLGFTVVATMLALLLRWKQAQVRRSAKAEGARADLLVRVPFGLAPFAFGITAASGAAVLLWSNAIFGALLLVLALVLSAHRGFMVIAGPRGPGIWKRVSDARALLAPKKAPCAGDALDLSTTKGRVVFGLVTLGVSIATWLLRTQVPGIVVALPLTSLVLVPVFMTGMRTQLPARPTDLASRLLRPTRDELGRLLDLSHVELTTIARTRTDGSFDEVRLACVPIDRTPGLRAIELALAPMAPGAHAALLEVLVRFEDGSEAAARIASIAKGAALVPGRVPEEKVARLIPHEANARSAAKLVARLIAELEGRRATDRSNETALLSSDARAPAASYRGRERRTHKRALVCAAAPSSA